MQISDVIVFPGGRAPYGYVRDVENDGKFIPDDKASAVVKSIFQMAAYGLSFTAISERLNKEKIDSPKVYRDTADGRIGENEATESHGRWTSLIVKRIIENPVYLGHVPKGPKYREQAMVDPTDLDRIVKRWNSHIPLVSDSLYRRANLMRGMRLKGVCGDSTIFDGKVFCASCGSPLMDQGEIVSEGGKQCRLLECRYIRTRDKRRCISPGYISLDMLDEIVKADINGLIEEASESTSPKSQQSSAQKRLEEIDNRIKTINRVIQRVYEDVDKKVLCDKSGQDIIQNYNVEIQKLLTEMDDLVQDIAIKGSSAEIPDPETPFEQLGVVKTLDQDTIDAFIDNITVAHRIKQDTSDSEAVSFTQEIDIAYSFSIKPQVQ